jgi:aspartyl-tRNA(Asn)/glutamyl-tRNA(Gln) amidotransferase subunit A
MMTTIAEVAEHIRARELSPVALMQRTLDEIERLNSSVHAFVTVCGEEALAQARAAETEIAAGRYRGPLHGIPFAVKDVYQTKGIRTTAHSHALVDWIPDEDACTIARLRDAGAILAGKLATFEFSTGAAVEGPFPPARNPWNLAYTPMGSSSGSGAAVAAGMVFAALGGDTGGSVRLPAAACGCVGIRPTYGRVSRRGVIPLSWSLDAPGPITRSVRDCAYVLGAIAGYDPEDPASAKRDVPDFAADLERPIRGMRVGVDRAHFFNSEFVEPSVIELVDRALEVLRAQGAVLVPVALPMLEYVHAAQNIIHVCESHAYQAPRVFRDPRKYGPTVRAYFRLGAFLSARDYLQAQRVRELIRREMVRAFGDVDVIAAPTLSRWAERFDEVDTGTRFGKLTGKPNLMIPFSNAGVPAITVPCGFSADGLPLGLQIAGRPFAETTVFQVAAAYERATPWHTQHPKMEALA